MTHRWYYIQSLVVWSIALLIAIWYNIPDPIVFAAFFVIATYFTRRGWDKSRDM